MGGGGGGRGAKRNCNGPELQVLYVFFLSTFSASFSSA